jgi:hypothetical protein
MERPLLYRGNSVDCGVGNPEMARGARRKRRPWLQPFPRREQWIRQPLRSLPINSMGTKRGMTRRRLAYLGRLVGSRADGALGPSLCGRDTRRRLRAVEMAANLSR